MWIQTKNELPLSEMGLKNRDDNQSSQSAELQEVHLIIHFVWKEKRRDVKMCVNQGQWQVG